MNSPKPLAKVLFRVPNEDGTSEVETLWAFDLGEDRYRLDNSPFFAYGVSVGDVVSAPYSPEEGFPTYREVLEKRGNRTIRVIFDPPVQEGNAASRLIEKLVKLGVEYEGATPSYIALSLPTGVDFDRVVALLVDSAVQWEHADPTYESLHGHDG